jgi:hypothetical protein
VRKRAQSNLRPHGAAVESDASLHGGNIQPKPKKCEGQNGSEQGGRFSQH